MQNLNEPLFDLTNPQMNIWTTEQYYNNTSVNNVGGTVLLKTKLDFSILKQAVTNVLRNNDNFHIHIAKNSTKVQQYFKYEYYEPEIIEVKNSKELHKVETKLCVKNFDLCSDKNLFETKIFKLPNNFGGVIVVMHHIISDSWTLGLYCKEIVNEYQLLLEKNKSQSSSSLNPTFSYLNFIKEENDYLNSSAFQKDQSYWNSIFETVPEIATIPSTVKKEEHKISCVASRANFDLSSQMTSNILNYCKSHKISAYNFLMAIYSLYIGRVSNLNDFVVGTPILNRLNYLDKQTNGMFVSTIPLRINIDDNSSFLEFSKSIGSSCFSMLRHQRYPYQKLLSDLRKKNSTIPNLYNIILSYQITSTVNDKIDCESHWIFNENCADDLQIHIVDYNNSGRLSILYDYKEQKYVKQEISQLHSRICHIIEQVLSNDKIALKDIDIITPEEKSQILYEFNNTKTIYPRDMTVIDLFEKQVLETPDKIAIVFENTSLTYFDLNKKANQLAYVLLKNNVKPNDIVGIFLDKSLEMIVSILAILKCGAIYLPIDITYPESRISYMLQNSKTNIILSDNINKSNFTLDLPVINVSLSEDIYNSSYYQNTNHSFDATMPAYIMYTSGSTGTPKGVVVNNRNIIRLVKNTNYIHFEDTDHILQTGSIVFDACTFEIWSALLNGISLYIIKKDSLLNAHLLKNYIRQNDISILWLTAPLFNTLCEDDPSIFDSVKYLLTGGDVLSPKHINKVKKYNPNLTIINGYGPTENTTFSCCFEICKNYNDNIPIGKPIANSTCYVVSTNGKLQPIGIPGELWVGGDGVSAGYLNNSELTNQKFITNFFDNDRIYKTGDLVKWLPDGNIEFIGRIDNQVKIRGFRVELNEVNNRITEYENVKASYTTTYIHNNEKTICSYVIFKGDNDTTELKQFLKKSLPIYMIPTYIVSLKSFPLNANGKINKALLPAPSIKSSTGFIMPRNKVDKALIRMLKNNLNLTSINLTDSFVELGGDSLSAITLIAEIENKFHIQLHIKDLLTMSSILEISDYISNTTSNAKVSYVTKATPQEYYPLSSAQKRIYYACKIIGENSTIYNTPCALLIDSILDADKVEKIFNKIIKKQTSFRTVFCLNNNEIKQKIVDNIELSIPIFNNSESDIDKILQNFTKPFDLEKAPLIRIELHYLNNLKTLLLIDSHHIIVDGVSINILLNEFFSEYNNNSEEKIPLKYTDYAVWENKYLESDEYKKNEDYWINRFKDYSFESLNLPYDYTIPANRTYIGEKISSSISDDIFNSVSDIAKRFKISNYTVFLVALYICLYKYTKQADIVIGSPVANRSMLKNNNIIGMFVNNLAFRAKILPDQTVSKFLKYVNDLILQDLDNQCYPYDHLIKKLHLSADNSKNPLFDIMFSYQNQSDNLNLPEDVHYLPVDTKTSKFNITLEIVPKTQQINIEYRTDLFKKETIVNFSEHYLFVLKQLLNNSEISVNDIKIITPSEQETLNKFNDTLGEFDHSPFCKLFEKQVQKTPKNIAVVCDNKILTYDELNKRSNSLANYLISHGIKNNDIVAIMTNRSLETIVCMLAILKAGGAFLNIDPTYPIERTQYYISDSNIQYVLTQSSLREKVANIKNIIEIDLGSNIYTKNFHNPDVNIHEQDLSYIIYTSGSTGTPKGVMLSQIGLSNMVQAMSKVLDYLKDGQNHAIASVTSTPFDIFVYEIVVSLAHGMKVVMANNAEHRNPKLLDALIKKYDVDVMTVTPSLMKINYDNREPDTALANVKNMVFGGEPLPEKFVKDLKALSDDITIYNIYGPSEITVLSNVQNLDGEKEITVGPPIMNTQIHILDSNMKQVPIGVVGEIYIAGIQVGKGYIGKTELTNHRFLKNPFGPGKIYKSGDIGRWTFDGKVQCLGRIDNQIKLRGLRIELSEIEDEISKMPGVSSCVVNKITLDNKECLCAYYVCSLDLTENQIKENLRKFLPHYMIPTHIVKLDAMPYTINRKIDRKALPLPKVTGVSDLSNIDISSLTSSEEKLTQIWKNILKVDNIDVNDNFFDIGGDSISAINMQIEALKYGLEFEYADIFNYPTIKQLSKKLPNPEEKFMSNYDYSCIDNILKNNNIDNIKNIQKYNVGNVLLVGGTGYLGSHIIESFLKNETGTIYCLIRQKNNESPLYRINRRLEFYFGKEFIKNFSDRIKVLKGDITQKNIGLSQEDFSIIESNISTVINAGAIVKHFGLKDEFENINVTGTKNIIDLCIKAKKRLLHISTISISGFGEKEEFSTNPAEEGSKIFTEQNLYIGQNIKGIYTTTKYKAEISVLEAIRSGLDAQILRIGNITNRYSDGKFQKNITDNAFARRIKSFVEIGAFPKYMLSHDVELTPVDICAEAVIKILDYTSPCNVFHLYNPNLLPINLFYDTILRRGISLTPVSNTIMTYIIKGILSDDSKKSIISGIVQDLDKNKEFTYISKIGLDASFTKQYLAALGFNWNTFDSSYIDKCFNYFEQVGFIDKKLEENN